MLLPRQTTVRSDHAFAGSELSHYLHRLTGEAPTESGYPFRIHVLGKGDESYRITVTSEATDIWGNSERAAVYGVYALLEDVLGCQFFAPDCEVLPDAPALTPGVYEGKPAFSYREVYWRQALDGRFALKRRLNSARANIPDSWGGRVRFYNYSHSFETLVSPDDYFDGHPEYFSQVNGIRQRDKSQLCLTNPEVLKIIIRKVKDWMRQNPDCDIFSVAMNDWYAPCECERCAAIDQREGGQAGSMIAFVNQVAEAVQADFPGKMIHTFAYLYCRKPPRHIRPGPHVIVRLCPIECCFSHGIEGCGHEVPQIDVETTAARGFAPGASFAEDLKGWAAITDHLYIWDYTTNYANYLQPFPNLRAMQDNLLLYKRQGVSGVFLQGNYAPGQASAFGALKIYLASKLLWQPDCDLSKLTKDFVNAYYGEAAASCILSYIALCEEMVQSHHMSLFDAADAPYLTSEMIKKGGELFQTALRLTQDPICRERVEREYLSVRFIRLVSLPMDTPGREEMIQVFAQDCRRLGISELFERRALEASFECLKNSMYARDRRDIPHAVYRL